LPLFAPFRTRSRSLRFPTSGKSFELSAKSFLETLGFKQHAGDIVVLGRIADEEIEFRHEALE
jgi:hypothetical protein